MIQAKSDYLIEVSWEVCNKVGGIYTVIQSKADNIINHYKDKYFLIGPYFADKSHGIFLEETTPKNLKDLFSELEKEGIIVRTGKWLIKGEPNVYLIDFQNLKYKANDIKRQLWEDFKIDSLRTGFDYDEPIVFSYAANKLLKGLIEILDGKTVIQFHEWLTGVALLFLKKNDVKAGTVFTTHATVLGRSLSSNNIDLFCRDASNKCNLEKMDLNNKSYQYCVEAKHQVEKASAQHAGIFTTVSEITALEAFYILGRKADVILPNGLYMDNFPTFEEASIKHKQNKWMIQQFLMYYFFPYYIFDVQNTLIYFLAGRYEFRDKGIDVFIKALDQLNLRLKKEKSEKTIVAFIWVPTSIRGIKPELLVNKTNYSALRDSFDSEKEEAQKKIMVNLLSKVKLNEKNIFSEEFLGELKRMIIMLKNKGNPPLSTHDLMDPNDMIMKSLLDCGLDNDESDRVKVIFYPIYLTGADRLLDLNYYQSMNGSHLGVFPSAYEPWGYTPLEAGALGVSSVTTDLAGFGKYVRGKAASEEYPGVFVLKRENKTDEEIIKSLSDFMYYFANLTKYDRVKNKLEAKRLAGLADWKILIENYIKAHNMALEKIMK